VAAIDDRDGRVGVGERRVGERHPRGPRTDNEIVRFEFFVYHSATIVVVAYGARRSRDARVSLMGCSVAYHRAG
jgi:hypothetical protein